MGFMFLISFVFALWTSCFSFAKMALQYAPPIFFTGARMLLAGVILLIFLGIKNKQWPKLEKKHIIPILLLSVFSVYLTNVLEYYGLQRISASKTCFIYSLTPFFSALFSYIHFNEKMNPKKWLGMIIGFSAILPVLFSQGGFADFTFITLAEIAVVGATFFSMYGWILIRILVKDDSISYVSANGFSMLIGGAIALLHSFFVDSWNPTPVTQGGGLTFLQGLLAIILISNIICFNLYGYLLKKYTATFLSFVGLLSPVFASFSEWIILGAPPSPIIILSSLVVIAGLWIVYQEELKQGYIIKKSKVVDAE